MTFLQNARANFDKKYVIICTYGSRKARPSPKPQNYFVRVCYGFSSCLTGGNFGLACFWLLVK